jgi:peptidoglycan-N-acetylglucosamine deacetylase
VRRSTKKATFTFFNYKVQIIVSQSKRKESFKVIIPKVSFLRIAGVLFFCGIMGIALVGIENLWTDFYYTKSSPLFSEISPVLGKQTPVHTEEKINIRSQNKILFKGSSEKKDVALTFDADMTPEMRAQLDSGLVASSYNHEVIEILRRTNTKATLFVSGMWIQKYPEITKSLAENDLFELANHSYSHPGFHGFCYGLRLIEDSEGAEEVKKTQELLKKITGRENKLFRFPGGCYSEEDLNMLYGMGITAVQWDVAGQDGFNEDSYSIESNVLDNVQNGSIIVLHMNGYPNSPLTAIALPRIIETLKNRGFTFVTVSDLIASMHESPVQISEQYFKNLFVLRD